MLTKIVSVPESCFKPCKMTEVSKGATTYEEAFYDVSEAYMLTAEDMAICNVRLAECGKQQEKLLNQTESK